MLSSPGRHAESPCLMEHESLQTDEPAHQNPQGKQCLATLQRPTRGVNFDEPSNTRGTEQLRKLEGYSKTRAVNPGGPKEKITKGRANFAYCAVPQPHCTRPSHKRHYPSAETHYWYKPCKQTVQTFVFPNASQAMAGLLETNQPGTTTAPRHHTSQVLQTPYFKHHRS